MHRLIPDQYKERYDGFKAFVAEHVATHAEEWDREQTIPRDILAAMGSAGYFGCTLPRVHDGRQWGVMTFGLLNEAFGRASSALTGVITVQAMVSMALLKWGSAAHKSEWLPRLSRGEAIAAFALTEPGGGSAIHALTTSFNETSTGFVLNGTKRWISCAQFADVFLVFGTISGASMACLVPRRSAGLQVEPITELMGFRAAGLAEVRFDNVEVPATAMVGKPGFALSHVAPVGLHYGRISTACSALGLLRGCFEESVSRAATRRLGDDTVGDMGMIRSLIASMGSDLEAASLLNLNTCQAEDDHLPDAFERALIAKYFTSRAAVRAASDAVQIHGASGCHAASPVSRFYRDAKIMEIIEGTTQIHENLLGRMFVDRGRSAGNVTPSD